MWATLLLPLGLGFLLASVLEYQRITDRESGLLGSGADGSEKDRKEDRILAVALFVVGWAFIVIFPYSAVRP